MKDELNSLSIKINKINKSKSDSIELNSNKYQTKNNYNKTSYHNTNSNNINDNLILINNNVNSSENN